MSLISRKDWSTLASSTASWQASSPTSGMREAAGPSGGSLRSTIRRRSNSTSSTTSFSFQRKVIPSLMLTRVRGMEDIRHGDQLMEWGFVSNRLLYSTCPGAMTFSPPTLSPQAERWLFRRRREVGWRSGVRLKSAFILHLPRCDDFLAPDAQPAGRTMTIQAPKGSGVEEWGSSQIGFYTPPAQVRWLSHPPTLSPQAERWLFRCRREVGVEDVAFRWPYTKREIQAK